MTESLNRRKFMKIAGTSIGVGALYRVAPLLAGSAEAARLQKLVGKKNGETVTPFSFVQLSDTHVGFEGPPNPLGTKAFGERVAAMLGRPAGGA